MKAIISRKITAALLILVCVISSPIGVYADNDTFTEDDFNDLAVSLDCFLGLFAPNYQDVMRVWPMLTKEVLSTFVRTYIYHSPDDYTIDDNYFCMSREDVNRAITNLFGTTDIEDLDSPESGLFLRNGDYCVPAASGAGGFYETRLVSIDADSEFPHVTAERFYVSDFEDDRYIGRFCFGFSKDDNCDSGYHLSNMYIEDLAADQ